MDLRSELLKENSKKQRMYVTRYIGSDSQKFSELMHLFKSNDRRVAQLAAAVVDECIMAFPELLIPYWQDMIYLLNHPLHDTVIRNILRFMQFTPIPEEHHAEVVNLCFSFMMSDKQPIAVRAFAMTVAFNISQCNPDLKNELKMVIEDMKVHGSPGIKARGNKLLKKLRD